MQANGYDSTANSAPGGAQEAALAQMRDLLSAFERGIDGSGALIETLEVSDLRKELHGGCARIREHLSRLSDRTVRLERARRTHTQRLARERATIAPDRGGLRPELWPRA